MDKTVFTAVVGTLLLCCTAAFAQTTTTRSTSSSGATAIAVAPSSTSGGYSGGVPGPAMSPTAPSIVVGSPCMGAISGSGTSPMIGISLGMSYTDKECEARANAGALFALGQTAAAMQVLCQVGSIRKALAAAGTQCDGFTVASVTKVSAAAPVTKDYGPDYCRTASPGELKQHLECRQGK